MLFPTIIRIFTLKLRLIAPRNSLLTASLNHILPENGLIERITRFEILIVRISADETIQSICTCAVSVATSKTAVRVRTCCIFVTLMIRGRNGSGFFIYRFHSFRIFLLSNLCFHCLSSLWTTVKSYTVIQFLLTSK